MMLSTIIMPCFSRQAFAATTTSDIIAEAKKHLGKPYRWGGKGPNSFDCSGFVSYVFKQFDINLPSYIGYEGDSIHNYGQVVSNISDLKPGDIVIEENYGHVGIYVGNGNIIHAANPKDGVKIGPIYNYVTARRIIKDTPVTPPVPVNPYEEIDRIIFDANFYADANTDVRDIYGYDYDKLYQHWQEHGKKEGRSPSAIFDPGYYLANNSDVKDAVGNTYEGAYIHFEKYGYKEDRVLSPVFNMIYYKQANSDVKALGSNLGILTHFMKYGMNEGRVASEEFNPGIYAQRNSDIKDAFGKNYKKYYDHYIIHGRREGRVCH